MEKRTPTTRSTKRPRRLAVRISFDADLDFFWALKFGAAIDGQLEDETESPAEDFYVFRRGNEGPVIGFGVDEMHDFDLPDPDEPLMPGYRFDAPTLALRNATAEAIVLAARTTLDGLSTPDVVFYDLAVEADSEGDDHQSEIYWRACLAAGDPKAHLGLGYTLCDLGRPEEAYGHLLEYTRIVPRNGWAWTWLGEACEGIGETRQAVKCYRRALRLEAQAGSETDAGERLRRLEKRGRARRRPRRR
jgi:tetratricopeptide (TPR) repeat protein